MTPPVSADAARADSGVDAAPSTVRLGGRRAARYLAASLRLAWRAAPATMGTKLVLVVVAGVGPVVTAWVTKVLLDRLAASQVAGGGSIGALLVLAASLGAVGLVVGTEPHVTRYVDQVIERALRLVVASRLYTAVNSFAGLARLESPRFQDRLQLAVDAGRLGPSTGVSGGLGIGTSTLTSIGFVGSLLAVAPVMVPVVGLAALPIAWVEVRLSRRRAAMIWRLGHSERREAFYERLLSSLEAAKEIRMFRLGEFFGGRLLRELGHINREQHAMDRRELVGQVSLTLLGSAMAGGGLVWVVSLAATGQLTIGDVALFVAAVAGLQGAVRGIVSNTAQVHQALLLFGHYQAVVNAPPDLHLPAQPATPEPLATGIELHDVWFRYAEGQPWALQGVDLVLPAGSAVALVGVNGAGKSTLIKLLCRFYDPVQGSIRWNGTDLREFDLRRLRERLSVVFQDFMAYDLSAAENIGVGDLANLDDRERLADAARQAGCHEQLAGLPSGYDTLLSRIFFDNADVEDPETGVLLSGGMWQRVAVARALFRDRRDLVILDEPSAGLDAEAEYEVHATLRRLRQGRTSLLVSHRLSTVRDADLIVVLDNGRVVEQGTHDALMASAGRYAQLFTLQASGYQLAGADAGSAAIAGEWHGCAT